MTRRATATRKQEVISKHQEERTSKSQQNSTKHYYTLRFLNRFAGGLAGVDAAAPRFVFDLDARGTSAEMEGRLDEECGVVDELGRV